MIKKILKKEILMYVVTVIILLYNYTSYFLFSGKISKESVLYVPLLLGLCILFVSVFFYKIKFNFASVTVLLILYGNILLTSSFFGMDSETYMLLGAILFAFIISNVFTQKTLIDCYVNTILFLAIYSLIITYIIMPLYLRGGPRFPIYEVSGKTYLDAFISSTLLTLGMPRNSGFCREPGVYQVFLLFALFFCIEYQPKDKKNIVRTILLMVVLFSTFSAVAYICIFVSIIMLIKKYSNSTKNFIKTFSLALIAILIGTILILSNDDIRTELLRTAQKWSSDNSDSNSLAVRASGVWANIELFFERPLLGNGLVPSWLEIIYRFGYVDVTGTTLSGFAAYGVIFGVVIHWLLWRACRCKKHIDTAIWFFAILLSTLSQNLIIANLFWCFLFLGFAKKSPRNHVV